ncbi:hypothetical protein [Spiroplasma melliferum]|uniref:Transposase n=2 Tax=Spiroplasma melliferum TaxID=2134 RepID=A0AAI9X1Q2_SPIME|nr:hypothetical protein [Spiroplasma melliferum]KAI93100.1 hypothetical protein SPM_000020 [Spiroplasma melliferum KC3]QCO24094.1 hypothetical protein SRED_002576 [Spiroplasma melliferum]
MLNKINNSLFGTYGSLYYDATGLRKKNWNQKYSDELVISCLKDFFLNLLSCSEISKKYNVPIRMVYLWNSSFKFRKGYRFDCENGICDQLDKIITIPKYRSKYPYDEIKEMYLKGFKISEIIEKLNLPNVIIVYNAVRKFKLPRRYREYRNFNFMW